MGRIRFSPCSTYQTNWWAKLIVPFTIRYMGINGKAVDGQRYNMFSIRGTIYGIDYGYDGVEFLVDTPLIEIEKFCASIVEQLTAREEPPWFAPAGLKRGSIHKIKLV